MKYHDILSYRFCIGSLKPEIIFCFKIITKNNFSYGFSIMKSMKQNYYYLMLHYGKHKCKNIFTKHLNTITCFEDIIEEDGM